MEEIFAKNKQQVFHWPFMISHLLHCQSKKSFALVIDLQNTLISKESETISVDDVADIFKMYGVDYKEVKI